MKEGLKEILIYFFGFVLGNIVSFPVVVALVYILGVMQTIPITNLNFLNFFYSIGLLLLDVFIIISVMDYFVKSFKGEKNDR